MKTWKLATLLATVLTATASRAAVRNIHSYQEILPQLGQAQLVVFDLDNTIMRPLQSLGSDQWYEDRVQRHLNQGLELDQAIDAALKEWVAVQKVTGVRLTEKNLPEVFAQLKSWGIPVMGLTARPLDLIDTTLRQLASIGISFAQNQAPATIAEFAAEGGQALYRGGILFVGPKSNKGVLLKQFLQANQLHPQRLSFFDDKPKHVNNVEKALAGTGIDYTGFRYGAMDSWMKAFDREATERAFWRFLQSGVLTPDETGSCEQALQGGWTPSASDFDSFLQLQKGA